MRTFLALLLALTAIPLWAGSGNFYAYSVHERSNVRLSGSTNINTFECISQNDIPRGLMIADLLPGSNAIFFSQAALELEVASFDCGHRAMNKDFHNSLGGMESPYIQIILLEVRPLTSSERQNQGKIRAGVAIMINGKTRNTDIVVEYNTLDFFSYKLSGSKELRMSEFGIDPPSPALGLVKVNDRVTIHFDLVVETSLITQN
jgi:hypothetical protein